MLTTLSKYFYIYLLFVFLLLITLTILSKNITLNNNLVYIFSILLLPLFDTIIDFIISRIRKVDFKFSKSNILKYFCILLLIIVLFVKGSSFIDISIIGFGVFGILFNFDSRISFLGALVLFFYIPLFWLIGNTNIVTNLTIYAYYLLILGIVFQILEFLFFNNKNKGEI